MIISENKKPVFRINQKKGPYKSVMVPADPGDAPSDSVFINPFRRIMADDRQINSRFFY